MSHAPEQTSIVVIPARGGSKRIPRKNLKLFHGRPIIAWSIAAAQTARTVARVVVSTDDEEIAEVAESLGAEVPFRRSAELADDHAGTVEVIRDAVERLDLAADVPVCCLYATAPMVTGETLDDGLTALESSGASFVFPVVDMGAPIERVYREEGGRIVPVYPDKIAMRSQDLPVSYFDAGQFYWARAKVWRDPRALIWDDAAPIHVDRDVVQDIDTPEDWSRAERLFAALRATDEPAS